MIAFKIPVRAHSGTCHKYLAFAVSLLFALKTQQETHNSVARGSKVFLWLQRHWCGVTIAGSVENM